MNEKTAGRKRQPRAALLALSVAAALLAAGVAGASADNYVAFGDSYTAGPVIPNQIAPLGCLKSDHNYPHLAAGQIGLELRDPSCSGAQT